MVGGRDKNVIHIASMRKRLVFVTACSPLCTTYCTRMRYKKIYHKRPFRDRAQKHRYFTAFYAQTTDVFNSVFASLYYILHKDVEQEIYHKRPCLSRPCPKTLVFTAFYAQNTGIYGAALQEKTLNIKPMTRPSTPKSLPHTYSESHFTKTTEISTP